MVTENTIQDALETGSTETTETVAPDPILAKLDQLIANQGKLENRVGFLQRRLENLPQGQAVDPALRTEIAEIKKALTEQNLLNMSDAERADYYRQEAEKTHQASQTQAASLPDNQLQRIKGMLVDENCFDLSDVAPHSEGVVRLIQNYHAARLNLSPNRSRSFPSSRPTGHSRPF